MKHLYESILDDDDDILDDNSVIMEEWFEKYVLGKYKYTIYKQGYRKGSMKVDGNMTIKGFDGELFPSFLTIYEMSGNIIIEKCPNLININNLFVENSSCNNFTINNCPKLISLIGSPERVYDTFTCVGNKSLKSLEGCPFIAQDVYVMKNGKKFKEKEVYKYIKYASRVFDSKLEDYMDELITEDFISEALNEPHLLRLADQLKKYPIKRKDGVWLNFKELLGQLKEWDIHSVARDIQWDEIDSTNVIDIDGLNREAKILVNKIVYNEIRGLILVMNSKGEFTAVTDGAVYTEIPYSDNIDAVKKYSYYPTDKYGKFEAEKYSKDDIKSYLKYAYKLVFIINWNDMFTHTIHANRIKARDGMVLLGDPEYYKKIALDNIQRYKKMIAQNRTLKRNKEISDINTRVKNILDRYNALTTKVIASPILLANNSFEFGFIADAIGEKLDPKYHFNNPGLLLMLSHIILNYVSLSNGKSSSYDEDSMNNYIKKIKSLMDEIDNRLKKFGV